MPLTLWRDIIGERCDGCGGYATHWYGAVPLCCQCHGGDLVSQEEARRKHEQGDADAQTDGLLPADGAPPGGGTVDHGGDDR
jgi:hypothetical protein